MVESRWRDKGVGMLEAPTALAPLASSTIVAAATTDAWDAARSKFALLLGRGDPKKGQLAEKRLDETRQQLEEAGPELEQMQAELGRAWQVRLADLLEEDPGIETELRALVEEIRTQLPAGTVAAVDHAVAMGRDLNISALEAAVAAVMRPEDVVPPDPTRPGPVSA
jgi:hypothetical protein